MRLVEYRPIIYRPGKATAEILDVLQPTDVLQPARGRLSHQFDWNGAGANPFADGVVASWWSMRGLKMSVFSSVGLTPFERL